MKTRLILTIVTTVFCVSALAGEKMTLEDRVDIENQDTMIINVPVGELYVKTHDKEFVDVEVEVKEKNGWFNNIDWDEVELTKDVNSDTVSLRVDVEDTQQEWRVYIPKGMHVDLDMGVGKVQVIGVTHDVEVDLGVGDAEVELAGNNYRKIDLDSGVGDADLDGFKNVSHDRSVVSKNVSWRGDGDYEIEVDVGVGDIEVEY